MKRRAVAFAAGTVLSGLAAGLLGGLGPSAGCPPLSARHPLADYRALAGAPFGSAMQLFMLSAAIYATCFLAAGLLARRRTRGAPPAVSEMPREADNWYQEPTS